ncbi:MAG: hypothetical protein CVV52_06225 [Spirochaetae bacterium HGW-Spirochaetae-8]|jgi:sugar phosphate isomerase/epimerase|nr:MAG: hypothetical protein CVV52_06225 [Spirochaetae bacterium HGW-Spirochaetae-8]
MGCVDSRLIAVNTLLFGSTPIERICEVVKAAGLDWIEPAYISSYLDFNEATLFTEAKGRQLAEVIANAGLKTHAIAAHMDIGDENAVERMTKRIEFAAAFGVGTLISNASCVAKLPRFVENIEKVSEIAQKAHIVLALENPGDGEGALLKDGRSGVAFVKSLRIPNVRMNYDVSNALSYAKAQLDVTEDAREALADEATVYLHLKDMKSKGNGLEFCPIGDGIVGYRKFFKILLESGRKLPISLEMPIQYERGPDFRMYPRNAPIDRHLMLNTICRSMENIERMLLGLEQDACS